LAKDKARLVPELKSAKIQQQGERQKDIRGTKRKEGWGPSACLVDHFKSRGTAVSEKGEFFEMNGNKKRVTGKINHLGRMRDETTIGNNEYSTRGVN